MQLQDFLMKRTRLPRISRQNADSEALLQDALALGLSSSRLEDAFWQQRLNDRIQQLLKAGDDDTLNAVLDRLYQDNDQGYEPFIDLLESCTESHITSGQAEDLLLIAIPILAWSRFTIPAGPIPAAVLQNIRVQLQAHVLARDVRLGLADFLFSPDQLPPGFSATARFTGQLGRLAQQDQNLHIDPGQMPEAVNFLSDTRYLLAVAAVAHGQPIFRWQEASDTRAEAFQQWQQQGGEALRPLFTACAIEPQWPLAFFSACRESDRAARPFATKASVAFLQTVLPLGEQTLQATIAPFQDERRLTEYRVGFSLDDPAKVIHGLVWPLLDNDDEDSDIPAEISRHLKEAGIAGITVHDHRFPAEYCEDCGAPLYPAPNGDTVHAEMPEEESPGVSHHLH